MPNWICGASRDLEIEYRDQWRGDEAAKRVLDLAGIGTEKPDHVLAKSAFLICDASAPDERGSYKDGFTDVFDGKLKCVSRAIEIMPGFIGKTDVPQSVKDDAMRIVDAYQQRIEKHEQESGTQACVARRRLLPKLAAFALPDDLEPYLEPEALKRWDASLRAASATGDVQIDILGPIGAMYGDNAPTDKSILAQLRAAAGKDICVNINSPGGSYIQGVAIYSALREYAGKITAKVLGQAASAASIVMCAADNIQISSAGLVMIHNVSGVAMGTRHDMTESAGIMASVDAACRDLYAARTKIPAASIETMMDDETYLTGKDAVAKGFADSLLPSEQVRSDAKAALAARSTRALFEVDAALASAGRTRAERRELIAELTSGKPRAAAPVTPRADLSRLADELRGLHATMTS